MGAWLDDALHPLQGQQVLVLGLVRLRQVDHRGHLQKTGRLIPCELTAEQVSHSAADAATRRRWIDAIRAATADTDADGAADTDATVAAVDIPGSFFFLPLENLDIINKLLLYRSVFLFHYLFRINLSNG